TGAQGALAGLGLGARHATHVIERHLARQRRLVDVFAAGACPACQHFAAYADLGEERFASRTSRGEIDEWFGHAKRIVLRSKTRTDDRFDRPRRVEPEGFEPPRSSR